MRNDVLPLLFFGVFSLVFAAAILLKSPAWNNSEKSAAEKPCVGNCPPPGPMDCTIYGRKKDGSWPSGYECSSTP